MTTQCTSENEQTSDGRNCSLSKHRTGCESLTPTQTVEELDKYIISQHEAKKAVAIALRNRWRRMRVPEPMRDEITPKNIIMIGPTGVGKTEISRRLAKLARAPFVKVEASKFTEVGYVGRDVDSIVRDLVEVAHAMVREEEREAVKSKAESVVEEQLLDLLLPGSRPEQEQTGDEAEAPPSAGTRERLRDLLRAGKLEDRVVEVETTKAVHTHMQVLGPQGLSEIEGQIKDMFSNMFPKQRESKRLPIADARKALLQEAQESLIDQDSVARKAIERAEQSGIVFIDEIDKVAAKQSGHGPDVSREGVQRDLLPLVEGSTVSTKHGPVRTDHVLFIASGAFHVAKPSDLMPEFQGRFPIRVELGSLSADDFVKILSEPQNALTKQYSELLRTEQVDVAFTPEGIEEIARLTAEVNSRTENIGARRLHTLIERLLEDVSFDPEKYRGKTVRVDRQFVQAKLQDIVQDVDLSRFIL